MKTAICCIAKDEDNYIDQFIQYHLKLGFDYIFIHCNNWKYEGVFNKCEHVKIIQYNGFGKQMICYNQFIKKYHNEYDWCAFIDVDQFITLKQHNNIKDFLINYQQYQLLGLNWNVFVTGDVKYDGKNFSLINRFFCCRKKLNRHIKCLIHFKLSKNNVCFTWNPHNVAQNNLTITVDKKRYINGPWNDYNLEDKSIAYISHYFFKTKQEFIQKINKGLATNADQNIKRNLKQFEESGHDMKNIAQDQDYSAYNFYNNFFQNPIDF